MRKYQLAIEGRKLQVCEMVAVATLYIWICCQLSRQYRWAIYCITIFIIRLITIPLSTINGSKEANFIKMWKGRSTPGYYRRYISDNINNNNRMWPICHKRDSQSSTLIVNNLASLVNYHSVRSTIEDLAVRLICLCLRRSVCVSYPEDDQVGSEMI